MKKSIVIVSAAIMAVAVAFTACTNKNIYVDSSNETHILSTDEDGSVTQNEYGHVYEIITDEDGKSITHDMTFPSLSTNKSMSIMENKWARVNVPKKWKCWESDSIMRMRHSGDCVDVNASACQIDFETRMDVFADEAYDSYKTSVEKLYSLSSDITDFTEFETTICGKEAQGLSYKVDSKDTTIYYYCIQNGHMVSIIKAVMYDKCYKDSEAVVELLESCLTFKTFYSTTTSTTKN